LFFTGHFELVIDEKAYSNIGREPMRNW